MQCWFRNQFALLAVLVISSMSTSEAADKESVELPLKKVVMFNTGVAYYEHRGTVSGTAQVDMQFDVGDVNDLLKSMVLEDKGGGKISTVTCDAHEPITNTLRTFTIDLTDEPTVGDLLRQIRGERVVVDAQPEVAGVILGIELRQERLNGQIARREMLNLLTEKGIRSVDLGQVRGIALSNKELNDELHRALGVLATGRRTEKKVVRLKFEGEGERSVRVGYVRQSPIWKTSYRLVLRDEKPLLQGWAIVENTSEVDWDGVELTLVSGQPISFVMNLYEPLFVQRPEMQQELFGSVLPPIHGLDVAQRDVDFRGRRRPKGLAGGGGGFGGGGGGFGFGGGGFGGDVPPEPQLPAVTSTIPFGGVEAQAAAQDVGDLYEYRIKGPVSIARRRSAMLPIVNDEIDAERIAVFNPATNEKHPLSAARLHNVTDVHLTKGPVTVFDGGSYAGDSQIEAVAPKSKRLISYAIDLATEISRDNKLSEPALTAATLHKHGKLLVKKVQNQRLKYTVKNSGDRDKTVLLEHIKLGDEWKLISETKPAETTASIERFSVEAEPGVEATVEAAWRKETSEEISLEGLDDNQIAGYVENKVVSDDAKVVLRKIALLRAEIAQLTSQRASTESQSKSIQAEQSRIRQNMSVLDKGAELYGRYLAKFNKQEDALDDLKIKGLEVAAKMEDASRRLAVLYGKQLSDADLQKLRAAAAAPAGQAKAPAAPAKKGGDDPFGDADDDPFGGDPFN